MRGVLKIKCSRKHTMESTEPQIIELGSSEPITLKTDTQPGETNFGGGIELLMNDKRKSDGRKTPSTIKLDDVGKLEAELNELGNIATKAASDEKSSIFKKVSPPPPTPVSSPSPSVSNPIPLSAPAQPIELVKEPTDATSSKTDAPGKSAIAEDASKTEKLEKKSKTWDGFSKFGNIAIDPVAEEAPKLSPEEEAKLKFRTLKKLEQLESKGVKLTKHYTMDSSLNEMQGEYEHIVADRERKASTKFQGRMLMAAVTGLEFLNNRFDPFDIKLDGWSEQIGENLEDYDEIFGELHEKYKSKATMAPELKLLFQLGGSAIMVHMTNTMFKSALPGMDDIMRQNPDLMQHFSRAAADSMSSSHPGLSSFLGSVNEASTSPDISRGPPPAPVRADTLRGSRDRPAAPGPPTGEPLGDGIRIEPRFSEAPPAKARREMRGPSDVSADVGRLLANLKRDTATKKIEVPDDANSTISQAEVEQLKAPPRPAQKSKKTPKNSMSLDL